MPGEYDFQPYDFSQIPRNFEALQAQKNQNALFPLELQSRQMGLQLSKDDFYKAQLAQASNVDESDPETASRQWDQNMERAAKAIEAAGGDPKSARQYIGRYSKDKKQTLDRMYSTFGAGTPASARGGVGGVGPGNALAGAPNPYALSPDQLRQMTQGNMVGGGMAGGLGGNFELPQAQITPQQGQLQAYQDKMRHVASEVDRVLNSKDPQGEWDRIRAQDPEAAKLDDQFDRGKFEQIQNHLRQAIDQIGQNQFQTGIPQTRLPAELKTGSQGEITAIDTTTDPSNPTARQIMPPTFAPSKAAPFISGYTKDGRTIYYNPETGKEEVGANPVETGRYQQGGGGGRTFNDRAIQTYLGAMDADPRYANVPIEQRKLIATRLATARKPISDLTPQGLRIRAAAEVDRQNAAALIKPSKEQRDRDIETTIEDLRRSAAYGDEIGDLGDLPPPPKQPVKPFIPPQLTPEQRNPLPAARRKPGEVGSKTPPTAAVQALRANPALRAQFDEWYGPGSAQKYLGQ